MTAPPPEITDAVARWLADDCPLVQGDAPHWAVMGPDLRARHRLAAVDLLTGPLAPYCYWGEET